MSRTFGEILAINRKAYGMRTPSAVGGPAGTTPLGDRPGTTSTHPAATWSGTAAGRARLIALSMFGIFTLIHMAAEARYID